MPDKDINVHVKAQGTEKAKQQVDKFAESTRQFGDQTADANKKAGDSTEQASQKFSGMGRILNGLKSQVLGFAAAWLGMQGVQRIISGIIAKLERMQQLQKEIYDKSLTFGQVGQALEFQTGTTGKQQAWSQKAAKLQKSGGLSDIGTAQQMMISADIAFSKQGGIKNPQVMATLEKLAPFAGAGQLSGEEVAKLFEFSGAAGIEPTEKAYKEYFAKVHAGFTSSKATSFGGFVIGLQKGATGYLSQGGSLDEAISSYSSARAVMSNEALAATMLEQTTRLSEGGYEKPRKAIEKALGVKWDELSMDDRSVALLRHIESIPTAQRTAKLVEQGVPMEIASGLSKMVSQEAKQTFIETRQSVSTATSMDTDRLGKSYIDSDLGKQRVVDAKNAERIIATAPRLAAWQRRLQDAQGRHEILAGEGKDKLSILDSVEPHFMAYTEMQDELKDFMASVPKYSKEYNKAAKLQYEIESARQSMGFVPTAIVRGSLDKSKGAEFEEELSQITINHYNNIIYEPAQKEIDEKRVELGE